MPRLIDLDPAKLGPERRAFLYKLRREGGAELRSTTIKPRPYQTDWAPLSFSQQRLWFLDQLDPGTSAYSLPILLRVLGPLNRKVLAQSLQEVVRRHEILRTVFGVEASEPAQIVLPRLDFVLPTIDLTNLPSREQESEASRLVQAFARLSFDLSRPPLIQGALFALSPSSHQLLVVMHHIISDGWSLGILINEVSALYEEFLNGRPSPLPGLPIQYADFAVWQQKQAGEILEHSLAWWRENLAGAPSLLDLPIDRPRSPIQSFRGSSWQFSFDASLIKSMQALAQQEGVSLFMLMLAAWAVVLSRHADQDDILLGSPVAGRQFVEVERLIGLFVNTLILRMRLDPQSSFIGLLRHVREITLDAYQHQDLPFEILIGELAERDLTHSPLFQAAFFLQSTRSTLAVSSSTSGLTFIPIDIDTGGAKFDLTLVLQEREEEGLEGALVYNADLFDDSTAERMLDHFQALLKGGVSDPKCQLGELPFLSDEERFQIVFTWNDTAVRPLSEPSLYQWFQAQAALCSGKIAIIQGKQRFTFAELNLQVQRLAVYLVTQGVGPEVVVGLRLGRSPDLVVAALAVLAAGGAYLPLDSSYPEERQAWILNQAGASLVIVALPSVEYLNRQEAVPLPEVKPENLAYILYTSGSTGRPKGVMVEHRALMRYIDWAIQAYEVEAGEGVPVHSSLMYDLTVTSFWVPLLAGRPVILLPEERGVEALVATVRPGSNFSLVKLTPSHLDMLAQQVSPDSVAGWTRSLVLGGEALRAESLSFWREHAPETRIFNEYGPAETVVGCSVYEVQRGTSATGPVPIGQPISGARLYVLGREFSLVPIGTVGELWIGGEGVTRGYLGRPDLTAERFLPDPYSTEPGARMYRSGDLVRWAAERTLEYRGRIDQQIKIRGFRIELGEIEENLRHYPGVRESVVMALAEAPGKSRLVAYVSGETLPHASELQTFLAGRLPEYMIPDAFLYLEALPLTHSGKIDKRALPQPDSIKNLAPPRTPIEELLADIWADVLGLEEVGIQDNFWELGGHSLLATRVLSRISETMGTDLPLQALFASPTIAELAGQVASLLLREISLHDAGFELEEPNNTVDAIYDEMIALVRRHGNRPGLREALHPLREKLQALQEIEAQKIAGAYDSHFRSDYERTQILLAQARELLNKT